MREKNISVAAGDLGASPQVPAPIPPVQASPVATHSALPWKACKGGDCSCGMIWDGTGNVHVATLHDSAALGKDYYGSDMACLPAVRKANAAFIVLAVNSHHAMKEALEQIAGGSVPNASTLAINGDWHGLCESLQTVARSALSLLTKEI